jgi:hypothetical protein
VLLCSIERVREIERERERERAPKEGKEETEYGARQSTTERGKEHGAQITTEWTRSTQHDGARYSTTERSGERELIQFDHIKLTMSIFPWIIEVP